MPQSHNSKLFGVSDAKVAPLTADPAGGAATYGTAIDVPGIKSMSLGGDVTNAVLRGDNGLLDSDSTLSGLSGTMEMAKLSLDLMAAFLAGTVVDSGTTPAQLATWALPAPGTRLPYFGITAKTAASDSVNGDVLFTLFKCVISSYPGGGLAEEDYSTISVDFVAMPRVADNKWHSLINRETAAALIAPA